MSISRIKIKIVVVVFTAICGAALFSTQLVNSRNASDADYDKWISETYDFRFGSEDRFAPGNAKTHDGKFIPAKDFTSSARCASCHTDIHPQWQESAHAKAFVEPFYQKNVSDLQTQKNVAFTRHCESCHNPTALFSGALTDNPRFTERPFDEEGVSCIVCHSIESVSGRGIGGYTMGQPALLMDEDGTRVSDASDDDITNDIEAHKRAVMRDLLKKPEFCAACHKSQVPKELNDYKFMRAFMVGDEYQQSSFSKETPHPAYTREKQTCNTCHMVGAEAANFDVSAKEGVVSSHRFAAANTAIPMVYGFKKQFEEVVKFMQDDRLAIDIFALHRKRGSGKTKLYAPIDRKSIKLESKDRLIADVVITNKNIGHSFPPELRDFYEAYVEFEVADVDGNTIFKSGFIKPDGNLDTAAHNYKTYLVRSDGSLNDRHHIWETRVVAYNNAIQSGKSDVSRYEFVVPEDFKGELRLTAKLKYRRFTKVYSDYVLGRSVDLPIVEVAASSETLSVGKKGKSGTVKAGQMPDWWRWNNYGIALLDQKQFPEAADAFDEVIDFKNDYRAVAYTNKALALIEMGGWKDSNKLIKKALKLDENNYRAIFQKAKIERVLGKLEEAEEHFLVVLAQYPNDRITLQQLGELAKIKSESVEPEERTQQLEIARNYYEKILEIDPEDLSANYNLMLIYQKLKLRDKATEKAKLFRELKDDPSTAPIAGKYLQNDRDIGNESKPYHTHKLGQFDSSMEKADYLAIESVDWTTLLKPS